MGEILEIKSNIFWDGFTQKESVHGYPFRFVPSGETDISKKIIDFFDTYIQKYNIGHIAKHIKDENKFNIIVFNEKISLDSITAFINDRDNQRNSCTTGKSKHEFDILFLVVHKVIETAKKALPIAPI